MLDTEPNPIPFDPKSPAEHRLVLEELNILLQSPYFRSSKRYPALLSFVVEERLKGRSENLKERIIGIQVFSRPADYDTNNDTIVRVTAGEVRKRLSLANHDLRSPTKVRISLPSGSYRPEFLLLSAETDPQEQASGTPATSGEFAPHALLADGAQKPALESIPSALPGQKRYHRLWVIAAALVLCGALVAIFWARRISHEQRNSFNANFWQPLAASQDSVLVLPGALTPTSNRIVPMGLAEQKDLYPYTSFSTAVATANIIKILSYQHKPYDIQGAQSASLDQMRHHEVVILGAYNNAWMPELQKDLPLQFGFGLGARGKIYEVANPARSWSREVDTPIAFRGDYALVARFRSRESGNWVFLIGGIGANGTEAASQFVSTPQYLDTAFNSYKDWSGQNIELLLKLNVVDGKSGAPSVEEVRVW